MSRKKRSLQTEAVQRLDWDADPSCPGPEASEQPKPYSNEKINEPDRHHTVGKGSFVCFWGYAALMDFETERTAGILVDLAAKRTPARLLEAIRPRYAMFRTPVRLFARFTAENMQFARNSGISVRNGGNFCISGKIADSLSARNVAGAWASYAAGGMARLREPT
ncbi:hypothetical protein D3C76_198070 [compost metagenome]